MRVAKQFITVDWAVAGWVFVLLQFNWKCVPYDKHQNHIFAIHPKVAETKYFHQQLFLVLVATKLEVPSTSYPISISKCVFSPHFNGVYPKMLVQTSQVA